MMKNHNDAEMVTMAHRFYEAALGQADTCLPFSPEEDVKIEGLNRFFGEAARTMQLAHPDFDKPPLLAVMEKHPEKALQLFDTLTAGLRRVMSDEDLRSCISHKPESHIGEFPNLQVVFGP